MVVFFGGGGVLSSLSTGDAFFGDGCITSCSGIGGSGSLLWRFGALDSFLSLCSVNLFCSYVHSFGISLGCGTSGGGGGGPTSSSSELSSLPLKLLHLLLLIAVVL